MNMKILLQIFSILLTFVFVILCSLKVYSPEIIGTTIHTCSNELNVTRNNNSDYNMNNSAQKPAEKDKIVNDEEKTENNLSLKQLEEFYGKDFFRTLINEISKIENAERKATIFELFLNQNKTNFKDFTENLNLDNYKYYYKVTESLSCNKKYYDYIKSKVRLNSPCHLQNIISRKNLNFTNTKNIKHLLAIRPIEQKCDKFVQAYSKNIYCKCKSIKPTKFSKPLSETKLDMCCKQELPDEYTMIKAPREILYEIFEKNELEKCLHIEENKLAFYTEEETINIELIEKTILKK